MRQASPLFVLDPISHKSRFSGKFQKYLKQTTKIFVYHIIKRFIWIVQGKKTCKSKRNILKYLNIPKLLKNLKSNLTIHNFDRGGTDIIMSLKTTLFLFYKLGSQFVPLPETIHLNIRCISECEHKPLSFLKGKAQSYNCSV